MWRASEVRAGYLTMKRRDESKHYTETYLAVPMKRISRVPFDTSRGGTY